MGAGCQRRGGVNRWALAVGCAVEVSSCSMRKRHPSLEDPDTTHTHDPYLFTRIHNTNRRASSPGIHIFSHFFNMSSIWNANHHSWLELSEELRSPSPTMDVCASFASHFCSAALSTDRALPRFSFNATSEHRGIALTTPCWPKS